MRGAADLCARSEVGEERTCSVRDERAGTAPVAGREGSGRDGRAESARVEEREERGREGRIDARWWKDARVAAERRPLPPTPASSACPPGILRMRVTRETCSMK